MRHTQKSLAALACVSVAVHLVAASQFPGQGDANLRSTGITNGERAGRGDPSDDDRRERILVPGKDDRVQIDRWTFAPGSSGIDPLTQIVRILGPRGGSGSGFLLPNCRVMTNLHVAAPDGYIDAGVSLAGKELSYESVPIPWLDNARARGRVVILGHGRGGMFQPEFKKQGPAADEDWVIGYDLGCASDRYNLGVIHLGEPIKDPLALTGSYGFAAGFSAVTMTGLSPWEYPLYIDARCRVLGRSSLAGSRSSYETNCSSVPGASGQPFLSGLQPSPDNPNVFASERGRPRLVAWGMTFAGGGYNRDVPNFYTKSYELIFDEAMMRRFAPFLNGPVNIAAITPRGDRPDLPEFLLELRPRYTDDARRRRVEGTMTMDYFVRADGTVSRVNVAQGIDPGLDQLAIEAAQKAYFAPALRNGVPVDGGSRYTHTFRLPPQ